MADIANRYPENIAGKYYVDSNCIDCDLCRSNAPQFFARHDLGGHSYVHRQPETPSEIALAETARLACPTDTIGNDG